MDGVGVQRLFSTTVFLSYYKGGCCLYHISSWGVAAC